MSRKKKKGRALRRRYAHSYGASGITVRVHGTLTMSPEDFGAGALGTLPVHQVHELPAAVVDEVVAEIAPVIEEAVVEAIESAEHDYYPTRPEY